MKKTKVLVLDFDNCIILDEKTGEGSEDVKDEAWFQVFHEYDRSTLTPVLEHAKREVAGGKGDRKDIVERVCRAVGTVEEEIPDEIVRRCDSFNDVVQEGILKIGVSTATRAVLNELSSHLPMYINTGTPRENVLTSLDALGITPLFRGVLGRPGTKEGNLREVISGEGIIAEELLFVDDQTSAWKAAQEVGCRFVGIHTARNRDWHSANQPFPIIRSLAELKFMV